MSPTLVPYLFIEGHSGSNPVISSGLGGHIFIWDPLISRHVKRFESIEEFNTKAKEIIAGEPMWKIFPAIEVIPAAKPLIQLPAEFHASDILDVKEVHRVGPYEIVECVRGFGQEISLAKKAVSLGEKFGPELQFHVFLDGKETHVFCHSLDEALVYAIGKKRGAIQYASEFCVLSGILEKPAVQIPPSGVADVSLTPDHVLEPSPGPVSDPEPTAPVSEPAPVAAPAEPAPEKEPPVADSKEAPAPATPKGKPARKKG